MLPKPATFVLEPGDRFFHQLLVVSVIKIHPLGVVMRSRSRSDVYSRGETDRGLARAHTTANLLSIESEPGILEVCVRARLHRVGAPVVYLPVAVATGLLQARPVQVPLPKVHQARRGWRDSASVFPGCANFLGHWQCEHRLRSLSDGDSSRGNRTWQLTTGRADSWVHWVPLRVGCVLDSSFPLPTFLPCVSPVRYAQSLVDQEGRRDEKAAYGRRGEVGIRAMVDE
jgi:hypothetical protein